MNTRFSSFTRTLLLPLAMVVSFLEAQTASARAGQPVGMGSPPSVAAGARARASAATAPGDDKTSPAPAPSDDAQYAPLWLYQGNWIVTPKNAVAGAKPDRLENQCGKIGRYFACQQTVNGKVGSLIIFIPAEKSGHYYTQAVLPEGWATGRGELQIEGDHWTYLGKDESNGKTTYYRTTNEFTGKDRIHYEQAESPDGQHWTAKNSGDEKRGGP
jgi:hypothetical protein